MTTPEALAQIRSLTQARLTLGSRGRSADTATTLRFALDHAQARAAVLSELDVPRIAANLGQAGLAHHIVTSAADTRDSFVRRPDLGRMLPEGAAESLRGDGGPVDVALVLGDGLSAIAAALNGAAFMTALATRLRNCGLSHGPVILARQARVALGDGIAQALQADIVVMALGERPGLSAADSLGVYITHQGSCQPGQTTPDSTRNCLSNIRAAGLSVDEAAAQALTLILAMGDTGQSGVALSKALAARALVKGD
ncbi:MAG: ethanolamine ammonia-lyase subunit EutC [Roseicyclus sp.]|nr:ethanolamine ammonia-lyase subunit EutC [Roseicyclus sp.]